MRSIISTPNFLDTTLTNTIIKAAEELRADRIPNDGDEDETTEAQQRALRKQFIDTIKTKFFFLGFSFGASLQSFAVSVILLFLAHSNDAGPIQELSHEYYPIFRGIFLISFFFLLYGASIFIWRRMKVDYLRVFKFSYSHTYQYVLQGSTTCAHIMFSMFIIYVLTITGGFGIENEARNLKHLWPFLAFILPTILFFTPNDKLTQPFFGVDRNGYKQRIGLIYNIFAVILSPFTEVTFQRAFIADVLCSMPKVFTDLQYTVCIYLTGNIIDTEEEHWTSSESRPHAYETCGNGSSVFFSFKVVLSLLPYYLRLMQSCRAYRDTGSVRHIFNGFKYLLSLSVAALAVSKQNFAENHYTIYIWLYVSVVTTMYSYYWVNMQQN